MLKSEAKAGVFGGAVAAGQAEQEAAAADLFHRRGFFGGEHRFAQRRHIARRAELKKLVKDGIILLFGNNESPVNSPANGYSPFRQDSSFLYYFGQQRDGLVGVIDVNDNKEILIGNDIDIEDIVWFGSVDAVSDLAAQVGVSNSAPMSELKTICDKAKASNRKIHFLPPYRSDIKIQICDLLGIHPNKQKKKQV